MNWTRLLGLILCMVIVSGCSQQHKNLHIQKVGMIVDGMISDSSWNEKGFEGLLDIGKAFDVSVYFKENIKTELEINEAVQKLVRDGVNLIFGHSHMYGKYFSDIAKNYPNVHFVYFNGGYFDDNITSLNLNSLAIGFFSGMVAGEMSQTGQVGMIASYEWQPEIEGFFEGVKYQNADTGVHIDFINDWNNKDDERQVYERMRQKNVDVFYPTGESFSLAIVENAERDGLYTVGYLTDQLNEDGTVLMSMVQHVNQLYMFAAEQFNNQTLEGGIMSFGFQDGMITLGKFHGNVPKLLKLKIEHQVNKFIETNLLPHEQ